MKKSFIFLVLLLAVYPVKVLHAAEPVKSDEESPAFEDEGQPLAELGSDEEAKTPVPEATPVPPKPSVKFAPILMAQTPQDVEVQKILAEKPAPLPVQNPQPVKSLEPVSAETAGKEIPVSQVPEKITPSIPPVKPASVPIPQEIPVKAEVPVPVKAQAPAVPALPVQAAAPLQNSAVKAEVPVPVKAQAPAVPALPVQAAAPPQNSAVKAEAPVPVKTQVPAVPALPVQAAAPLQDSAVKAEKFAAPLVPQDGLYRFSDYFPETDAKIFNKKSGEFLAPGAMTGDKILFKGYETLGDVSILPVIIQGEAKKAISFNLIPGSMHQLLYKDFHPGQKLILQYVLLQRFPTQTPQFVYLKILVGDKEIKRIQIASNESWKKRSWTWGLYPF